MTRTEPDDHSGKPRRKLPIGLQTFRTIRDGGYYYVDKTAYIQRLVDEGTHYFLSRPRRFGKSLLVDTIKEAFEGNEALFRGLAIHDSWEDWTVRRPVVRLDSSGGDFTKPGNLEANVMEQLNAIERREGVAPEYATAPGRFAHLVEALRERLGHRVVVLVDEYDKPILDALEVPEVARANRNYLRGLYSTIKFADAHIKFTLLAGVSRFSKVSLFSGLNNLRDITLDSRYSAICGYTETDLDAVFAPELPGLDREEIRDWYNGYSWLGGEKVYNPFDILLLFDEREFEPWWFETGTPMFLVDTLMARGVGSAALDGMLASRALLSVFDVEDIATEALLFQTGYLTILERERLGETFYRLGYPNREVRQSLNRSPLNALVPAASRRLVEGDRLLRLLKANDFAGLEETFRALFASIPYEWYMNNPMANYEGYYATVFHSCFESRGLAVAGEEKSSGGRVDMAVRFNDNVYLFEFKAVEKKATGAALAQLQEKGYADKYRHLGQPIHLVGVEFGKETGNIVAFDVACV